MRNPLRRGPEVSPRTAVDAARWKIIQTANRHAMRQAVDRRPYLAARLLGMRQIQQAVCVVRRNQLVHGDVLEAAGFRRSSR